MDEAIKTIIKKSGGKVKAYLKSKGAVEEEAEDCFFEGLSAMVINIRAGKFNKESSLETYLFSICKMIWYKKFKRMVTHQNWADQYDMDETVAGAEIKMIGEELQKGLALLMGRLKDKCSEVLHLWSLSYSMTEIADTLGYANPQVAMNKKNKCLSELKNLLAEKPQLLELL